MGGLGVASPGTCGSGCSHLLLPFMVLLGVTSLVASFSQTPSYMMILRYDVVMTTEAASEVTGLTCVSLFWQQQVLHRPDLHPAEDPDPFTYMTNWL